MTCGEWESTLLDYALGLEWEIAMLRELVRELSGFADYACDLLPSCERCPMLVRDGVPCKFEKALQRMRELGIESDQWSE